MKALSGILSVGVLLLGVAVGWYEHGVIAANRTRLAVLREQVETESVKAATLTREREAAVRRLQAAQAGAGQSGDTAADAGAETAVDPVAEKLDRMVAGLKVKLKNAPQHQVPELALLTEDDWYKLAVGRLDGSYESERGLRITFAELRRAAKEKITMPLWSALQGYIRASNGQLPITAEQLAPFLKTPLDPAILRRYEIVAQGPYADVPIGKNVLEENTAIDPEFDFLLQIKRTRSSSLISANVDLSLGTAKREITRAVEAYRAANAGLVPADPDQLAKYFPGPVDGDELRRNWRRLGFGGQP